MIPLLEEASSFLLSFHPASNCGTYLHVCCRHTTPMLGLFLLLCLNSLGQVLLLHMAQQVLLPFVIPFLKHCSLINYKFAWAIAATQHCPQIPVIEGWGQVVTGKWSFRGFKYHFTPCKGGHFQALKRLNKRIDLSSTTAKLAIKPGINISCPFSQHASW